MVTPDAERRYVAGAFITLNAELWERFALALHRLPRPVNG
jgi:hypothetical protein